MSTPALQAFLVGATVMLLAVAVPDAGAAVDFAACATLGSFECSTVDVALDRSGALAGTLSLKVARKSAFPGGAATPNAVVALAGGPGQSALSLAPDFAEVLKPALTTHDLLVFDQRGTGASQPLHCATRGSTLVSRGRTCARTIGPARGLYTTAASVEDLEALRVATGYDKLLLYGVSYGTKLALDYAARYPDRVESLVLDSVVLPDGGDPLLRPSFAAMPRVLGELCANGACNGITGAPTRDLAAVVGQLARKPLRGPLVTASGRRLASTVDRQDLLNIVMGGDLNPALRAELPGSLVAARRGDPAPLIRLSARASDVIDLTAQDPAEDDFNDAVYVATSCEETLFPWSRAADSTIRGRELRSYVRHAGERAFRPFDSATAVGSDLLGLCRGWPDAAPAPVPATVLPNVPTLAIAGMADLRTPLEDAVRVRDLIPAAQVLAVPFTGHSVIASELSGEQCAERALGQFLAGQPIAACAQHADPYPPSPVPPRALAALHGTGGRGTVGRTITAVLRTIGDERRQVVGDLLESGRLPRRAGGLRGGSVTVDAASERLRLHGVVLVPGVGVSGVVPLKQGHGAERLTVRGPLAAHGRLTIAGTRISGRLGGRSVTVAGARPPHEPSLPRLRRSVRLRRAGSII